MFYSYQTRNRALSSLAGVQGSHVGRGSAANSCFRANGVGVRKRPKIVDAYNESEISRLLQVADDRSRSVFGFFLATGCREQEVAYMTWSDVDFDEKLVRITATTARKPPGSSLRLRSDCQ